MSQAAELIFSFGKWKSYWPPFPLIILRYFDFKVFSISSWWSSKPVCVLNLELKRGRSKGLYKGQASTRAAKSLAIQSEFFSLPWRFCSPVFALRLWRLARFWAMYGTLKMLKRPIWAPNWRTPNATDDHCSGVNTAACSAHWHSTGTMQRPETKTNEKCLVKSE